MSAAGTVRQSSKGRAIKAFRDPDAELTDQRLRFIDEYIIDMNGTRAAKAAGYSPTSAHMIASQLLARPEIQKEVRRRQLELAARCDVRLQEVIAELMALGFSNMGDYIRVNGDGLPYVDLSEITRRQSAAIKEVTVDSYVENKGTEEEREVKRVKLTLHDKRAALVDLGKHLGGFKEQPPQTPQSMEFTIKVGHVSPDGSHTATQISVSPALGVSETGRGDLSAD